MSGSMISLQCSIAAAAISFARRMRSISCPVLSARAAARSGVASATSPNAVNHSAVNVVGSPTMRSAACVPSDSSSPTRRNSLAASRASSSTRAVGGRASIGSYPLKRRTSLVHAMRAASSSEASRQMSTGSPSRGKTHASYPFIPQKFVRYRTLSGARTTSASSSRSAMSARTRSSFPSSRGQLTSEREVARARRAPLPTR